MSVYSVCVTPESAKMKKGDWFYGACARVEASSYCNTDVVWYSSNTNVATVNASTGNVYGKAVGTARIYAESVVDGTKRDYMTITVTDGIMVSSVSLNKRVATLQRRSTLHLSATVSPSNARDKSLSWRSSDTNVATVYGDGIVTAVGKGYAVITAAANDGSGKYDTCSVTVTDNTLVYSVEIDPSSKTMNVGDTGRLYATVCPSVATCRCVRWSSSNSNIVAVNEDTGIIYAKKAGSVVIYATAVDGSGVYGTCSITVGGKKYVTSVEIDRDSLTLDKGETYNLYASVCPTSANDKTVRWDSGDPSIATVNSYTGLVTAVASGQVAIYARAHDGGGAYDVCCVTVRQPSPKPEEDKGQTTVKEGVVADPVDAYSGAHMLKNTVVALYGGQNTALAISYDSTRLAKGCFGRGWYHNYEKHVEMTECGARVYSSPSVYSTYICRDNCSEYTCTTPSKNGYVLTVDCSREYPYVIHCNSDHTEYYNCDGKLGKIVDHQGFATLISYSGNIITVTDTVSGKKLHLQKDATGKVVRVYDDNSRQATFTYSDDLLVGICDLKGNTMSYTYNCDGQVLTGVDANGTCYFTNTYDECGRVSTQKDGISDSLVTVFRYEGNKRITTDRNGNQSTRVFDNNGSLVSFTDENGNTKTYSYDARYNIIKETDALGNSVSKTYNAFNKPTSVTDKNGNTTYYSYDHIGNVIKVRYPETDGVIPEESFAYNSRNQLVRHTDLRGTVTVYGYDSSAMPSSKKTGSKAAVNFSYQNGLLKSQTDSNGNTTTYGHNAIGQVISVTNAAGKVTTYEYDAAGNNTKAVDANGKSVITTYDGNNQKTSVTDAKGNKTEYTYNGNMKNICVTLPDDNTVSYEYDGEDRVIKEIDQAQTATVTYYDKAGRVTKKSFADGGSVHYVYDRVGNVVSETNARGAVTTKTYDAAGNVLTVKDNDGNITRYQYDPMGRVIRNVNAASGTTVFKYSKAGDLLCETDAMGNKKTYTYDAYGNMLTSTDAMGHVTTFTYDENGNKLSARDAMGNMTTYTYNSLNQLVSVKNAKNNTVTYGYDALGRRTTVTDAKNNVFTNVYDANGNVLKTLDAKGNVVTEKTYNCLNLPATVTDSAGRTSTYTYNEAGKIDSITDSMNHTTRYSYDSRWRNSSVRDANDGVSKARYDTNGNITSLSGPLGGSTNYTYDDMGRLIAETTTSGGKVRYGYNELNVKKEITNARGQKRKYFYDACGRVSGFVGAEDSVSYTYDANGNVLTVTDSNGTIKREYDALDRVTKYTDTFGRQIRYEYDAVGNLVKLIYPDNTAVNYTYDANNNLLSVTDWANRRTTYTYDVNNRVTGVTKPDGSVTTTVYDAKQRMVSTVEKAPDNTVIVGYEYTYDNLSRIVEEKVLAKNTKMCYTYDNLNRVTWKNVKTLCGEGVSFDAYSYDAAGNITSTPEWWFVYDVNNRLTRFGGMTVSYDDDGNMVSCECDKYEYDSANRLIKAGGHAYTYNAEDVKIRNRCADADTEYTYNTNCRLSQLLQKITNGVTTKYVYGLGLIGEEKCGDFKTYHFDYRGSTAAITDSCGNVTDTFEYDTYGNLTGRTGNSFVIFGYNGRDGVVTDKNGLIYMRARYYNPLMHRFINADVVPGEISDAVTLNRYAYANGNPVSNTDPFGLSAEERGSNGRIPPISSASRPKNGTSIISSSTIPYELYLQIINSKLNSCFLPNQNGYGSLIGTDLAETIQKYTTQRYTEGGLEYSEGWESITYEFETLTVYEWKKQIITNDFYNETLAEIGGFAVDYALPIYFDMKGIPNSEAISELYAIVDNWMSENIREIVVDDRSRYISSAISGKSNDEEVTILLSASRWNHKKQRLTNEWKTSYIAYQYAWEEGLNLCK